MSILTELFTAEPSEAIDYPALRGSQSARARFVRVQLGGLMSLHFSLLWAIVTSEVWDVNRHDLRAILPPSDTWLFGFPEEFVRVLADLDEGRFDAVATQWARTEEMSCEPHDARYVLDELHGIAEKAQASARGLYLWGSL